MDLDKFLNTVDEMCGKDHGSHHDKDKKKKAKKKAKAMMGRMEMERNESIDEADMSSAFKAGLDALYSILNVEGATRLGASEKAFKGLDYKGHFNKVRKAIKMMEKYK